MGSDDTAAEIRALAEKLRSPIAAMRVLSGGFRTRVTQTLGAAAVLHDERVATEADRATIQNELREYRATLTRTAEDMGRLGTSLTTTMQRAAATEAEVLDVQKRALAQEKRERELTEEDRRLAALADGLGRTQHDLAALGKRLEEDASSNAELLAQTREVEDGVRAQLAALDARGRKMAADEVEYSARQRALSSGEGVLDAGREALRAAEADAARLRGELADRDARLADLQSRLEKDQAAVNEMHQRLVALVERAQDHERVMDGHYRTLESRLAEQDARAESLDALKAELDARRLAYDRERVELDARIAHLADLDERNEKLLRLKAYLDDDEKRLNAETAGVRENQKRTVDTWEELKTTLARIEALDVRVQETHDAIERQRAETERRDRELADAARRRSTQLDAREREILNWRMQSELRERKVQERYNELDTVEARKNSVRQEIEGLEREHASRISEWDREQQRARQLWAERRAEAEKARELYERNAGLVERRLADVAQREKDHQARAEALEERTAQLAERERRLRAAEERVRLLEEQRDSLNSVIASLTAQVGREWMSPESRLEGSLAPPPLDAPLDSPATTPPPGPRPGSDASSRTPGRN